MTREEAIKRIDEQYKICEEFYYLSANPEKDCPGVMSYMEALAVAISALRPASREQVEKVWRGEWIIVYDEDKEITIATCSKCGDETAYGGSLKADDCDAFCPVCGAPMTDEAVQMVMERLETLNDADTNS